MTFPKTPNPSGLVQPSAPHAQPHREATPDFEEDCTARAEAERWRAAVIEAGRITTQGQGQGQGQGQSQVPSQGQRRAETTQPLALEPSPLGGRVTGRTLVVMRCIAITGQLSAVLFTQYFLQYNLPLGPVLATIAASVLLNLVVLAQRRTQLRLSDQDATLYLAYDTLQLTLLLYLTGGMLNNPFTILLLAPLTVGAAVLSLHNVVLLTALNQACLAALAFWHYWSPWPESSLILPPLYFLGTAIGLSMAGLWLATYIFRVAHEARRLSDAFAASQMALAREQRLSALGGLAAAAAHELGTPLGTIALVAGELAHDVPPDSPFAEDVSLLVSQSKRCRDILAELARKPEADGGSPFEQVPLTALVEIAAMPHHQNGPTSLTILAQPGDDSPQPVIRRSPEFLHGVGNLIQNALQFARRSVLVVVAWDAEWVCITIADDGPGFSSHVLKRLGEPYLSTRADRSSHMGLGIFIAETLLGHSGGAVGFSNNRNGGAHAVVRWERKRLEGGG